VCSITSITESQGLEGTTRNHRVQPPAKACSLQQAAQVGIQADIERLQRRRLHSLSGQPAPVLRYPHCEEIPIHICAELPMLQFVAVSPCPITTHLHFCCSSVCHQVFLFRGVWRGIEVWRGLSFPQIILPSIS